MNATDPCPCGSALSYGQCCGRLHRGEAVASSPEQLMRSRYSAFAVQDADYLLATWHPSTSPDSVDLGNVLSWLSLQIIAASGDEVEFVARFAGPAGRGFIREHSKFVELGGRWFYLGPVEA
jgi:SEC-C motif domain protein